MHRLYYKNIQDFLGLQYANLMELYCNTKKIRGFTKIYCTSKKSLLILCRKLLYEIWLLRHKVYKYSTAYVKISHTVCPRIVSSCIRIDNTSWTMTYSILSGLKKVPIKYEKKYKRLKMLNLRYKFIYNMYWIGYVPCKFMNWMLSVEIIANEQPS